jgi:hydroxymethylpyrimidine/phosphomethylpyrimidine kinase
VTATPPPRVLTIAGSDSGGGAGIQADLKTMLALGVHGMSAVTAVTAQNSTGVHGYWEIQPEGVDAQLAAVLDDIGVDAVKTGMLASPELVAIVAGRLRRISAPLVVDPVCVSKHGDALLVEDAVTAIVAELLPIATVVTPNLPEVARLTGLEVDDRAGQRKAADALLELGPTWVLVKGGHLRDGDAVDLLTDGETSIELAAERLDTVHTHGTGCTLASAIATGLAQGMRLRPAIERARRYLVEAIRRAPGIGQGHGPLDHAHTVRAFS